MYTRLIQWDIPTTIHMQYWNVKLLCFTIFNLFFRNFPSNRAIEHQLIIVGLIEK
jgi:hypothetical protein